MAVDFLTPLNQGLAIRGQLDNQEALRQEQARQQQGRDLLSQANQGGLGSEAFKNLQGFDVDSANKLKSLLQTDDQGLDAAFQDAAVFKHLLQNDHTGQAALQFGAQRVQAGSQSGRNMIHTQRFMEEIQQDPNAALGSISSFLDIPNQLASQKSVKPTANIADFLFHEKLIKDGKQDEADAFANKAGLSKLNPQEQAQLTLETASLKQREKERTTRLGGFVNSGVGAADGVKNIRRSLELLKIVKTGGFDKAALAAKQVFGIESADEGELSNNLGTNVLSQLKTIFGSAFTEKEGLRLERLEAGIGKSPAANRRILEKALEMTTRAAKRGGRAAKELGDDFAFKEIEIALKDALGSNFDFSQQTQPSTVSGEFSGFKVVR